MKFMKLLKNRCVPTYYFEESICKYTLFACARTAHVELFIIFVVVNQI